MVHQPRQELHRQVFEGERRAVKKLEHESIRAELRQRRHRRVTEVAIGLARHASEIGFGDGAPGEGPDHVDGNFGIGTPGKAGDFPRLKPWQSLRHVEAAIAGEAREHGFGEAKGGGLAPGREVVHRCLSRWPGSTGARY